MAIREKDVVGVQAEDLVLAGLNRVLDSAENPQDYFVFDGAVLTVIEFLKEITRLFLTGGIPTRWFSAEASLDSGQWGYRGPIGERRTYDVTAVVEDAPGTLYAKCFMRRQGPYWSAAEIVLRISGVEMRFQCERSDRRIVVKKIDD